MDWNAIKVVLAIADTGSLSGAAKVLGVNHSTVFRRLNAFESEVGGRLFERQVQGYALTAMGEELLVSARNIADEFDLMARQIVGKDIQPKGRVKITAPNNIAYRYLPEVIAQFKRLYPDIQIELLVSNLEFNMNSRQADIAIRATRTPPEHLVGRQLSAIKWGVYVGDSYQSEAFQDETGLPKNLDELTGHCLIGASGGMASLPGFIWLQKHYAQQIDCRCDDLVAMSYMAESGQGLAFLPDDQQRPGLQRLFTFEPGETSNLWLLTHPDLRHVERIKLVMQHLTQAFSEQALFSQGLA